VLRIVTPSVTQSNVVEETGAGNKISHPAGGCRRRGCQPAGASAGAAASSVAAKSVLGTGPMHGDVAPASR
jgi:hypothetical protein